MANKTLHHKKALLEALTKSRGIVTTACEKVGVSRTTYYDYYNNDEEFKNEVDSLSDVALDFAESKLMEKMEGVAIGKVNAEGEIKVYDVPPSDTALIFYLKTKGRKRGYIEKQIIDQTVNDSAALIKDMPKSERLKRIEELLKKTKG